MDDVVDGYYHNKDFVESDYLPVIKIGDMVGFKYGKDGARYKVIGLHHYFYLNTNDGKVHHWVSVKVEGCKKYIQGNWVIKD